MYPARFNYTRAESLEHAFELLTTYGEEGRSLAGGMSLIPLMKLRLVSPAHLIDIGRLAELSKIERRDNCVALGAVVRYAQIEESRWLVDTFPLLAEAVSVIGDVQVRNAGTVGGNLAHADPAGDLAPAALALNASVVCRSAKGIRTVAADAFFQAPYTTALEPNELVTEVEIPFPGNRSGGAHLKLERRWGDFGNAIASVQLELRKDGRCRKAGIAIGAVGEVPLRIKSAEGVLIGERPEREAVRAAAEEVRKAVETIEPLSDLKAPAEYRREVIQVIFKRALALALERAQSSIPLSDATTSPS